MKKNIELSQIFDFPASNCYEALLKALEEAQVTVKSQDAGKNSMIAFWMQGMVQFTLAIACTPQGENATQVILTFRDDLTPLLKRPGIDAPVVHTTIQQKMEQIFDHLRQALGLASEKPAVQTVKLQRSSQKIQRIDYLSFFCLCMPLLWFFHAKVSSASGFSIILDFSAGLLLWVIYNLTLRKLWMRLSPWRYMEWICSNCNTVVPEKATRCPACNHEFSQVSPSVNIVSSGS